MARGAQQTPQGEKPQDLGTVQGGTAQTITKKPRLPLGVREGESVPPGPRFEGRLPANLAGNWRRATASRYYAGDEWKPGNTPQFVPELQQQLIAAGLLDEGALRFGLWDEKSAAAYRNVLELANREGLTAAQALQVFSANPSIAQIQAAMKGSGGSGRTVTLANPQDLQAVANEVAPQIIGRRLTDAENAEFIASFQSAQRGGGNPPAMEVAVEAFAKEKAPTEATARDMVGVFDVALNMMRGRASSG